MQANKTDFLLTGTVERNCLKLGNKIKMSKKENFASIVEELGDKLVTIKKRENVTGKVASISRARIIVDLDGIAMGLIPAKEFSAAMIDLKVGDEITAYVMVQENDEGYVILSLRKADKERYLELLEEKFSKSEPVKIWIRDANRGGLMVAYGNIEGFMPASQLASKHYPRGNTEQILKSLKALIGKELEAKVLTLDPKNNKIIFSEKAAGDSLAEELISKYKTGNEVEGKITGIVDFGIFVDLGEVEGLVHISEVAWDKILGVEDLERRFKVGDKIKVQIISNEGGRISLSVKRLLPDPWQTAIKKYKVGQVVTGKVTQVTPFGAFIKLDDNITGLMHISEFNVKNQIELQGKIKSGESHQFQILAIESEARKVTLSFPKDDVVSEDVKDTKKEKPAKKTAKKATKTKKEEK